MVTINSLQNRTFRLEGLFLGIKNEWPSYYLHAGIGYSIFSYQLQLYLHKCSGRHNRLHEALLNRLQNVLKGITTLSKVYLPVEFSPPIKLRQNSETALKMVQTSNPNYTLAINGVLDPAVVPIMI